MAWLWAKYKEKEITMRFNEFASAEDKLELLRLIDDAIWQTFDKQNAIDDNEPNADDMGNDNENVGQGMDTPVAAMPRLTTPPVQAYQPVPKTIKPKLSKIRKPVPMPVPKHTPTQRNPNPKPSKIHVNDSKLNQLMKNRSFGMSNTQNTSAADNWQDDPRQA